MANDRFEVVTLQSDGTALFSSIGGTSLASLGANTVKQEPRDTLVSRWKQQWGLIAGDTLLWIGARSSPEIRRDTLAVEGSMLVSRSYTGKKYQWADPPIVLKNHFHPRPAPAPTGVLAQLIGTWERQGLGQEHAVRKTIRADSTLVFTDIWIQGADTMGVGRWLTDITIAGDTLWWGPREGAGWRVVVQGQQLSLFQWGASAAQEIYTKRTAPIEP